MFPKTLGIKAHKKQSLKTDITTKVEAALKSTEAWFSLSAAAINEGRVKVLQWIAHGNRRIVKLQ